MCLYSYADYFKFKIIFNVLSDMQIQGKMVMKSQIMMEVKHKVNNYENEINDGYIQNIVQEAKVNQPIEGNIMIDIVDIFLYYLK